MKKANPRSIVRRNYRIQTTDSRHSYAVVGNHLQQDFTVARLAQKWISDLICIKTDEGWLYLTTVTDLADQKVIGLALSETMKTGDATVPAFNMALKNRPVFQPLLFHSTGCVQYTCSEFTSELKKWSVKQSMSRKGKLLGQRSSGKLF